jgi:thiamine kinase
MILQSIPGFSTARVTEQLSTGPTNHSFRVERGDESFVLRIDTTEAKRLGRDRAAEKQVCEAIATAGLGPAPMMFDAERGIYLRPFLAGRAWTKADLENPAKLERLAGLLRQVHALPPAGRIFEPLEFARRYADQLDTPRSHEVYEQVAAASAAIEPVSPVLCHNDLVCQNVLEGQALALIDWEYAGMGDPFFDLAVVVQHHGLGEGLARHFLAAYLGRQPGKDDSRRLDLQRRFYQALLELWNLRVDLP